MRRTRWQQRLYRIWYGKSVACIALLPLSWLYCAATAVRRLAYRSGLLATTRLDSRVIVVGNISVGGTGKTPLVVALAERLQQAGFSVGILTRGYLGRASHWPQAVSANSDPQQLGDEAVLLARRTRAAVFAGPQRVAAGRASRIRSVVTVAIVAASHPPDVPWQPEQDARKIGSMSRA